MTTMKKITNIYWVPILCIVKPMVFPVAMYGCENWTIKKVERWWTDVFKLWCWRRLLRVLWKARRSNQSTLKEINPEYSLEGLMLKLKLQYSGHLIQTADFWERPWWWERLKAEGGEGNRGWDGWMGSPIQWTWWDGERQGSLACCSGKESDSVATEQQQKA